LGKPYNLSERLPYASVEKKRERMTFESGKQDGELSRGRLTGFLKL
jgi:hypothetical protein